MRYGAMKVSPRFGSIFSIRLQVERISREETSVETRDKQNLFTLKRRLTFSRPHAVIFHETELFKTFTVYWNDDILKDCRSIEMHISAEIHFLEKQRFEAGTAISRGKTTVCT
jgi:hypothetical protein